MVAIHIFRIVSSKLYWYGDRVDSFGS